MKLEERTFGTPCSPPKKSYAEFPNLKIFQKALNYLTRKINVLKTSLVVICSQNYEAEIRGHHHESSDCFNTNINFNTNFKSLLKSSHPKKYLRKFPTPNPPKSFDHSRHLNTPPPPHPGGYEKPETIFVCSCISLG